MLHYNMTDGSDAIDEATDNGDGLSRGFMVGVVDVRVSCINGDSPALRGVA